MRRTLNRIWLILFCRVLVSIGYSLAFPYFAVYLSHDRNFSMSLIGVVMAASLLVSALAQIMGGHAADVLGRRPVILAGIAARSLTVLALAMAVRGGAGFTALTLLHWLGSFAAGFFDSSADAWVSDHFPETGRLRAFSWIRTGGNLGWALGPVLGGVLMRRMNYAELFFWTAIVYGVCFALLLPLLQESPRKIHTPHLVARGTLAAARDTKLWILGIGTILIGAVMAQIITPLSLYAVDFLRMNLMQVGLIFSLNGAIVVLLQIPLSEFGRTVKLSAFLFGGCLLYAAGYASLSLLRHPGLVATAIGIATLGEISVSPAMPALAANLAPEHLRGTYLGAMRFFRQAGWAIGPLVGGFGLARWGKLFPCPYWLFIGMCAVAASGVYLRLQLRLDPSEEGLVAALENQA